jgi:hypothetical protein
MKMGCTKIDGVGPDDPGLLFHTFWTEIIVARRWLSC